jgi:hypothetical protein
VHNFVDEHSCVTELRYGTAICVEVITLSPVVGEPFFLFVIAGYRDVPIVHRTMTQVGTGASPIRVLTADDHPRA